jgi:predicted small secreted protein
MDLAVKTILIIASLSAVAIFSSACNTTIGLGRDMRILGESMETQAQKTKRGDHDSSSAPVY